MPAFMSHAVTVRVPATSANLGPGFDALGLALALHDEVTARIDRDVVRVTVRGEGAGVLPDGEAHLVAASALAAFERLGGRPTGLVLDCVNAIPQARGLGSSSAAIVAGILTARALVEQGDRGLTDTNVLRLASEIEGHPDNVAACLLGGVTIAWDSVDGVRAVTLTPAPSIKPVVFVPDEHGLTAHARAALPPTVPHADAAANTGRTALLVHALTAAPELLFDATEDRLHQPYRGPGMPATAQLLDKLRGAGVPAVLSGAGPSVLALVSDPRTAPEVAGWRRLALDIDHAGAVVRPVAPVR
jgi:homoserine kinase